MVDTPDTRAERLSQVADAGSSRRATAQEPSLFCSNPFQQSHAIEVRYGRWLGGGLDAISRPLALRRAVIRRDGRACAERGGTTWRDRPIPVELEHEDGTSEDDRSGNLCMLCPVRRAQAPTSKVRNKGDRRHKRRYRYAAGQSHGGEAA